MTSKATATSIFICGIICFTLPSFSQNQAVLSIDFNDRLNNTAEQTQPGFQPFVMDGDDAKGPETEPTVRTFGEFSVKLEAIGEVGYDDRYRPEPTDEGVLSQSALLRDFVFAKTNNGLRVTVGGLSPDTDYIVSIWSYDALSKGTRVSRWFANEVTVANDHSFSGGFLPRTDGESRLDFHATTTASGEMVLRGQCETESVNENGKPDPGVFLNALQISLPRN